MIGEDIFRLVMEKTSAIPNTIYIARQEGSWVVCGCFDTYEKALECIRAQSHMLDRHYEILEVDLHALGSTLCHYDEVEKITKVLSRPCDPYEDGRRVVKMLREMPLEDAKEHVEALRKIFSPDQDMSFYDNIIAERSK